MVLRSLALGTTESFLAFGKSRNRNLSQGPTAGLAFACADGEYLQLWFGAKGAYEAFLAKLGDEPSEKGYTDDRRSGALAERSERWAATFATRERARWLRDFGDEKFGCDHSARPIPERLVEPAGQIRDQLGVRIGSAGH